MNTETPQDKDVYECPSCDFTSNSERGVAIHHAQIHGESIAKITVECVVCGTKDERYKCDVRNPDVCFCSVECESEYKKGIPKEEHPRWKGGKVEVECHTCGSKKRVRQYRVKRSGRFFCGDECYAEWKSEAYQKEGNPNEYSRIEVECEWCGGPTTKTPSRIERSKHDFCSPECTAKWLSENKAGPNHHQWKGGRLDYGPGWNETKRHKVRRRDGFECVDCGFSQDDSLTEYGRKLDVHHLIEPGKSINPAVYNAVRNLVTLCIPCHHKREAARDTKMKLVC